MSGKSLSGVAAPVSKGRMAEMGAAAQKMRTALKRHGTQPADISVRHALAGMFAALLLTFSVAAFVYGNRRADIMFSVQDGKLTPLQYTDTPNLSSEAVVNWAKLAITEIQTYNFNNIVERLDGARRFFTPYGWASFRDAFQEKGIKDRVVGGRQYVTTILKSAPVISAEGEDRGVYTWTVQAPLLMNVYTGGTVTSDSVATVLLIERIPTRDSWAGYAFGIARIGR